MVCALHLDECNPGLQRGLLVRLQHLHTQHVLVRERLRTSHRAHRHGHRHERQLPLYRRQWTVAYMQHLPQLLLQCAVVRAVHAGWVGRHCGLCGRLRHSSPVRLRVVHGIRYDVVCAVPGRLGQPASAPLPDGQHIVELADDQQHLASCGAIQRLGAHNNHGLKFRNVGIQLLFLLRHQQQRRHAGHRNMHHHVDHQHSGHVYADPEWRHTAAVLLRLLLLSSVRHVHQSRLPRLLHAQRLL